MEDNKPVEDIVSCNKSDCGYANFSENSNSNKLCVSCNKEFVSKRQ